MEMSIDLLMYSAHALLHIDSKIDGSGFMISIWPESGSSCLIHFLLYPEVSFALPLEEPLALLKNVPWKS